MARTLTGLNPQREQRRQEIILDRITARYQRRIAREIARAMRAAARNTRAPEQVLPKHVERMTQLLRRLWRESGVDMAEHISGQEKRAAGFERKQDDAFDQIEPTEVADRAMQTWVNTVGAEEIRKITDTTLRDVRRIISAGVNDGLSEKEIAKQLRSIADFKGGSRAQTIARTETHAAANVAAQATAQASGLTMRRRWVASKGERTRPTHREADGQTVGMDEPFTVGGVSLRFPGDQLAGAPRETINCRCAVVYVLAQ